MVKYGVASIVMVLYLSLAAWVVHREGAAYRQGLQESAAPAVATGEAAPEITEPDHIEPDPSPPESIGAPPAKTARRKAADAPAPRPTTQGAAPTTKQGPRPKATTKTRAKARPDQDLAARQPAREAGSKAVESAAPRRPVEPETIWQSPVATKSWDLDHLTADDERRLGADVHFQVSALNPPVDDQTLQKRLDEAAEPLVKAVDRKEIPYTFTILPSEEVNAFSAPGGYVYVSHGLMTMLGEDQAALRFILGHEIAHVDRQHLLAILRDDPDIKGMAGGTVTKIYTFLIPNGYKDAQDREADRWVLGQMEKLGHTRLERLSFLRKWEKYATTRNFAHLRLLPDPKAGVPILENHLRAHMPIKERLKEAKALIPLEQESPTR